LIDSSLSKTRSVAVTERVFLFYPMKTGDIFEGIVQDIAYGGEAVIRQDGMAIFVPFAAMGESIRFQLIEKKKKFGRGLLLDVLVPSPSRRDAPCPYFGRCGGCQYQHVSYEEQLRLKTKQLKDALQRLGGFENPNLLPVIASPFEFNYRNRISVHQLGKTIGFKALNGRDLVDITECRLATPEVNRKLSHLRSKPGQREHYSLRASHIPELGFFQANDGLLTQLKSLMSSHLESGIDSVVECYAGAGFFAEAYASNIPHIHLIEQDSRSLQAARLLLGEKAHYYEGSCEEHLENVHANLINAGTTTCIVDPPREGLSDGMRQLLKGKAFLQLLYLSCNPSTLARDLKELSAHWEPCVFQPVDLFPQTAHIECLVSCRRKE
jgi:23S rRNA (uracil1939-C5)-methyltransferase